MDARWSAALAALLLAAAGQVAAQQKPPEGTQRPMYRCKTKSGVSYSHVPCPDGKVVGEKKKPKPSARLEKPPQDRAVRTQVATRPAAIKEECATLEKRIADEQGRLKALPQPATPADEKDLVNDRIRFSKLKC